ncbi:MAG: hypothetical protein H0W44_02485 [Gammaproteobacteria bacterium]|nr:hypothetical protein [Gammaproteobacteria bacterium]
MPIFSLQTIVIFLVTYTLLTGLCLRLTQQPRNLGNILLFLFTGLIPAYALGFFYQQWLNLTRIDIELNLIYGYLYGMMFAVALGSSFGSLLIKQHFLPDENKENADHSGFLLGELP